jgi:hypothetical protein
MHRTENVRNVKTSQFGTDSMIVTILWSGGMGKGLWMDYLGKMQVEVDIL